MASLKQWMAGARPRTLPAALAPVAIGTGVASAHHHLHVGIALGCAALALALQVGVNYANDYSDGVRGTDAQRVGPARLVGSGSAPAQHVKAAAWGSFAVAAVVGLAVVAWAGQWWMIGVGAASIVAAWWYTGGRHPYGYLGLGEVFVFVFFGLVATVGTTYLQLGSAPWGAWAGAIGTGSLSCAILMANNIRDIPGDTRVGKRTLAVRLGDARARRVYVTLMVVPLMMAAAVIPWHVGAVLALAAVAWVWTPCRAVLAGAAGPQLIPVLVHTGYATLMYGLLYALGVALWS